MKVSILLICVLTLTLVPTLDAWRDKQTRKQQDLPPRKNKNINANKQARTEAYLNRPAAINEFRGANQNYRPQAEKIGSNNKREHRIGSKAATVQSYAPKTDKSISQLNVGYKREAIAIMNRDGFRSDLRTAFTTPGAKNELGMRNGDRIRIDKQGVNTDKSVNLQLQTNGKNSRTFGMTLVDPDVMKHRKGPGIVKGGLKKSMFSGNAVRITTGEGPTRTNQERSKSTARIEKQLNKKLNKNN